MTVLLVIIILVLLIVTHELGHFIAAKYFKVRVDEFGVGYPPRAYLLGTWGGTEYTLNWLPFGGFVRLFGEDAGAGRNSLGAAKPWKQAIILAAGVAANVLVAYLLFVAAFMIGVPRVVDVGEAADAKLFVSDVVVESPADAAGLIAGDEIVSVESAGERPGALTPANMTDFVRTRGGQTISLSYIRSGEEHTVALQPANAVVPGEGGRPALGVGLVLVSDESLGFLGSISAGGTTLVNAAWYVCGAVGSIIWGAVHGDPNLSQVVGPVGLVGVIGDAAKSGWGYVLELAAFIGVNLAVVNLIPIPALDGGRLAILGIETLTRRKLSQLFIQTVNTTGIALIILLMVVVTYNDIGRLFV